MLLWSLVDFAIKLIPIVGDILTAIIKPNTRNCMRVEALLRQRASKRSGIPAASGRTVPAPRGATAREPLLVSSQPGAQGRMVAGPGSGAAPSYGTVAAGAGAAGSPGHTQPRAEDRRSTRHLLPFWRRNDDSDSESEGEAPR